MTPVERLTEAFTVLYRPFTSKPAPLSMRDMAERLIAASPALAEAIELGLAWQAAEAALPEGWDLALDQTGGGRAAAIDTHAPLGPDRAVWGNADTPAEALRQLAAKLREAKP